MTIGFGYRAKGIGLSVSLLALVGCLGPDNETSTVKAAWDEFRFPVMKAGESWTVEESAAAFHGAVATVRILKDTVVENEEAYVASLTVVVPEFLTGNLDTVRHFTQSGRIYMRKSDQETVYETATAASDVTFRGDTAATAYRLESETLSKMTGSAPVTLKPGLAWTVTALRTRKLVWYFGGNVGGNRDTVTTETRDYKTGPASQVIVKAGSFPALEIDWKVRESGAATTSWFSEAAKATLRQIDVTDGEADTTELASLSLL